MGLKLTQGICVGTSCALGVRVRGDQHVVVARVDIGWRSTLLCAMFVINGTLPGILLCLLLA